MKIALFGINFGLCANVDAMVATARAAEAAGLESLWTGEHVVLPDPQAPPSPAPPRMPFLDPAVALAHAAAVTERIRLGTGIIILPQRNPLVLAKELTTVDIVSRGRLIFGLGSGYLEPEFRALGAPFEHRGPVTDEAIQVLKALWTMEKPAFHGRFFSFDHIGAEPRPVQKPHPPIIVGGQSRSAARRTVRYGDGWYGFMMTIEQTEEVKRLLQIYLDRGDRPAELGPIELSVTPTLPPTRESVERYAAIGVERLIFFTNATSVDEMRRFVDTLGTLVDA